MTRPSGGVYTCPVDGCDQTWSVPDPQGGWFREALRVGGVTIASFEYVLECHVQGHTAVDFLKTIQARDFRIAELEGEVDNAWTVANEGWER